MPDWIPTDFISAESGLPSGQVHDVAQMHGHLWFAGPCGLARYDGSRIKVLAKKDGLATHGIRCITACSNQLFVGSDAGIDSIDSEGNIKGYPSWNKGVVFSMLCHASGHLWVGTTTGVVVIDSLKNSAPKPIQELPQGLVTAMLQDYHQNTWLIVDSQLICSSAGSLGAETFDLEKLNVGQPTCIANGPGRNILVGGSEGACIVDLSSGAPRLNCLGQTNVRSLLFDSDEIWVGTENKLWQYSQIDGQWTATQAVLTRLQVNHLFRDQIGNIWCGTDSMGVVKISMLRHMIRRPLEFKDVSVFAMTKDPRGKLLIATQQGGFSETQQGTFEPIANLQGKKVWDIAVDHHNRIWAACQSGLVCIEPNLGGREYEAGSMVNLPCRCLLVTKTHVYCGTLAGLFRIDRNGPIDIKNDQGGSLGYVYTMEVRDDQVWVGTIGNGLWRIDADSAYRCGSNELGESANVYCILLREHDAIILANNSVWNLSEQTFRQVYVSSDPVVGWSAARNGTDMIWLGTSSGLQLIDLVHREIITTSYMPLGKNRWEFTTSRTLMHVGETLWCGLNSGLVIYHTGSLKDIPDMPKPQLSGIRAQGLSYLHSKRLYTIQYGKWKLEINVNCPWFVDEANLLFRYQLVGFDERTTEFGAHKRIVYTALPPGTYHLEIQTSNPLVGASVAHHLLSLDVKAPFLGSGWLFTFLHTIKSIWTTMWASTKNLELHQKYEEMDAKVRERTRQLLLANAKLESLNQELETLSFTDGMTGLLNRRQFDHLLRREIQRCGRTQDFVGLIMFDVDYFKRFNDQYGHPAGDDCLKLLAMTATSAMRIGDIVARYGGEEFVAIATAPDCETIEKIAERVREMVEGCGVPHVGSDTSSVVTVSVGVGVLRPTTTPTTDVDAAAKYLISQADAALYQAKEGGRNRVCINAN